MDLTSGVRKFRVLGALCIGLIAVAVIVPQQAQADTRVVTGGETRLEVNVANFVKLLGDGIFITPIAPAQLVFGSNPAAIFPASTGVADAVLQTATVPHQGGLHIEKSSIGQAIDATNVTLACVNAGTITLAGCHILNTANNLLPNELAEVKDYTFTDNGTGTVTITGRATITAVTALVLNTLFQTQVFTEGMELGVGPPPSATSSIREDDPSHLPSAQARQPRGGAPVAFRGLELDAQRRFARVGRGRP